MKCPTCKDINLVMTDRQGVEIDYCPECRGVWLDRGELDKIIERSSADLPPARTQHSEGRPSDYPGGARQGGHYRKKKGGLLGELFDF